MTDPDLEVGELRISGYRSVRALTVGLRRTNVIVGPNGCGKSNLYRSVLLLKAAARGELARALAREGGMPSVLWAGPRRQTTRRQKPVRLTLAVTIGALEYELACGLPIPADTLFSRDPEVKEERVRYRGRGGRRTVLLERKGETATLRDVEGAKTTYPLELLASESILSQLADPHRYPELSVLREAFGRWRFYHQFRTDPEAPLRRPQTGVRTFALADDGADLASALQTVRENGDGAALRRVLRRAFPHLDELVIEADAQGRLSLAFQVQGLPRLMEAHELSDGTLRFLCLAAALLSPRPPLLMALNEPETSLHPDLIGPLADLIVHAGRGCQLWITTHAPELARRLEEATGDPPLALRMERGATVLAGGGAGAGAAGELDPDPENELLW